MKNLIMEKPPVRQLGIIGDSVYFTDHGFIPVMSYDSGGYGDHPAYSIGWWNGEQLHILVAEVAENDNGL